MLNNSKNMFWQTLICSTFISAATLVVSCNAYAEDNQEEKVSEINQQLLMPSEAINEMTDINRTRRYYQTRENRGKSQVKEYDDISKTSVDDEIKLPPRTNKHAITIHVYRVDISDSEVFFKTARREVRRHTEGKAGIKGSKPAWNKGNVLAHRSAFGDSPNA